MLGKTVSHYRILEKLGEGGMGVVYRAQDLNLNRVVAIKFLSSEIADERHRQRFQQEAKTASSLNHPHILTVFDAGTIDGRQYLVTEFIEGCTLREWARRDERSWRQILELLTGVADALACAHEAGILHRDVKPENILVPKSGYAKLVDFGLAKLLEAPSSPGMETRTMAAGHTRPGTILGTVAYMSPEQAVGKPVDARSDIFAFGIVLYELLAGVRPFAGKSDVDLMHAILHDIPEPLAEQRLDVPVEVRLTVEKALEKEPGERYQSMREVVVDLKRAQKQGSREHQIRRHKRGIPIGLATVAVMVTGAGYGVYKWLAPAKSPASFERMTITRLTSSGKASSAAISPDGKYVVHVMNDAGQQSLWMRQVATGSNVQIAAPEEAEYLELTFSRDANFIYFTKAAKNGPPALYQMPVLGGTAKKLLPKLDGGFSLSPDGKQLTFLRRAASGEMSLIVANADGSAERTLAKRKPPDFFEAPDWSPDGRTIACAVSTVGHSNVVMVPVEGGSERPVGSRTWFGVVGVRWLADGRGMVVLAQDNGSQNTQVWHLSYPEGVPRRITNDLNDYAGVSLTANSAALVTVQGEDVTSIWVEPGGDTSKAKQITSGGGRNGIVGLAWTPDSHIVFSSYTTSTLDLWTMRADGSEQKQLTTNASFNLHPASCADGRYIVVHSYRGGGTPHIWRMDADGSDPHQLTNGASELRPDCSPDGKWVVYTAFAPSPAAIWKVPIEGGTAVQLTQAQSFWPAVSPDGKWIAFNLAEDPGLHKWRLGVMPFEGGPSTKTFDFLDSSSPHHVRWSRDGGAVTYEYARRGVANIWSQPLAGGPPNQISDFKSDLIYSFDWSPDGKQLACARGRPVNDVVLISGFY